MLGSRIAVLRHRAGMSQLELAKQLKISPSTIGMYEQGRREPSLELLATMAQLFDVSIDFLVTGQVAQPQEAIAVSDLLLERVNQADIRMEQRRPRSLSRQELAVLFAALLMET